MLAHLIAILFVASLNAGRGAGEIPRTIFAVLAGYVLVEYQANLYWACTVLLVWLLYLQGWGVYIGGITDPSVDARKEDEDPLTDTVMGWIGRKLGRREYAVVAMGVRIAIYSAPLFAFLGSYGWPLMFFSGLCWVGGTEIELKLPKLKKTAWRAGEWLFGILLPAAIIVGQ